MRCDRVYVHEGCLHSRQHPGDAPQVDVADQAFFLAALDDDLLQHAVLDGGDARLLGRHID